MKQCTRCKNTLKYTAFNKDRQKKDGLASVCAKCSKAIYADIRLARRAEGTCLRCVNRIAPNSLCYCDICLNKMKQKNKRRAKNDLGKKCRRCGSSLHGLASRCSDCLEIARQKARERYKRLGGYAKIKIKRKGDLQTALRYTLRSRLRSAIRGRYKAGSAVTFLGCSIEELKQYLENKFLKGMSWCNHGRGTYKWHIDHIRPLASFDLTDPNQLKLACHFTNLQPLWQFQNLSKGRKYEPITNTTN